MEETLTCASEAKQLSTLPLSDRLKKDKIELLERAGQIQAVIDVLDANPVVKEALDLLTELNMRY